MDNSVSKPDFQCYHFVECTVTVNVLATRACRASKASHNTMPINRAGRLCIRVCVDVPLKIFQKKYSNRHSRKKP